MKIIECDHKQYIRLGDLDHEIRLMRREIFDKYDRDENGTLVQEDGTKGITHDDGVFIAAITHVMGRILKNKVHACETPDEIREMHKRIESEFYLGKYVITTERETEDGKKELIFFKSFCTKMIEERMKEEGKTEEEIEQALLEDIGDPVFCDRSIEANFYEDYEDAEGVAHYLRKTCELDVSIKPAWYFDRNAQERLMKWLDETKEEDEKENSEAESK